MPNDHTPITVTQFGGLYRRGYDGQSPTFAFDDECPQDHFRDGLNFAFYGASVGTRQGARRDTIIANVKRFHVYRRTGEAVRNIILTNDGVNAKFYDSADLALPILTIANPAIVDFSMLSLFNRAFISPHNAVVGMPGEKVYIYNGSGTARAALGVKPVGALTLATSGAVGGIEVGPHLISVAGETDSGFITPPITPQLYTAPGNFKLLVTNIPTGPASWVARRLLASQVITYNGNPLGYAMFFVPNGRIPDNVTTTLTIDFFDSQLFSSADYLFDELDILPAGVFLSAYGSRLMIGGENANPSLVRVSAIAEPESFSSTSGFLIVDPSEVGGVKCGTEYRKSYYITKGTHFYVTGDNDGDPNTWPVDTVDVGIGSPSPFGFSQVYENKGANLDLFFVASMSGLLAYNGAFVKPEMTYKVEEIWKRINKISFKLVQVFNDVQRRILYVALPLDGAFWLSHILVGDYAQGLNPQDIRWSLWAFPWTMTSISVGIDPTFDTSSLKVSGNSHVYSLIDGKLNDDDPNVESGLAINCYINTAMLYLKSFQGWIHHFWQWRGIVWGAGTLSIIAMNRSETKQSIYESPVLEVQAGDEKVARGNFQNERASFVITMNNGLDWFRLSSFTVYAKKLWASKPL